MLLSRLRAKRHRGAGLSVQAGTALVALCCSPLAAPPVAAGAIDSSRLPAASTNAATNPPPASLVQSTNAAGTNSPVQLEPVVVTGRPGRGARANRAQSGSGHLQNRREPDSVNGSG